MGEAKTKLGQIKKGIKAVKILSTEDITERNKYKIKENAKHSEMGQAIVQTYPDLDFQNFDIEKFVHIRAAFLSWLNSKATNDVYTLLELENLLKLMKLDMGIKLRKKIEDGREFDKIDWDRMKQVFEHLTNLHKLKHGDKHIVAKIDFKDLRDMYTKDL